MTRPLLLLAGALVLVANGMGLAHAYWNRAMGPQQTIDLTEYELPLEYVRKGNSATNLRLASRGGQGESFGRDVLRELGVPLESNTPYPAYVALEYAGRSWQEFNKRDAATVYGYGYHSRLIAVDVSRTPDALRRKYRDSRYLILRCVLRNRNGVVELLPGELYVPLPYSETLSAFRDTPFLYKPPPEPEPKPRYTVKLAVGRYYEPWILNVKRIE